MVGIVRLTIFNFLCHYFVHKIKIRLRKWIFNINDRMTETIRYKLLKNLRKLIILRFTTFVVDMKKIYLSI